MGNDNERANKRMRRPSTGGKPARITFGGSKGSRTPGELGKCPHAAEIMDFVIQAGDALMVSTTADGGAVVVTLLSGDSREKAYAVGQMELDAVFDQLEVGYSPT